MGRRSWVVRSRSWVVGRRSHCLPYNLRPTTHDLHRELRLVSHHRLLAERARHRLGADGLAEMEALRLVAAAAPEEGELVLILDSLSDDAKMQAARDRHDRGDNRGIAVVGVDAGDEAAIDLHRVE